MHNNKPVKHPEEVLITMFPEEETEIYVVIYAKPSAEQKAKLLKKRIEENMV
jgi:hypothetical protein